ncbi:MAG TPA: IS481 family transposase [Candidatus Limnocylindrales bacterium]|nr:IS481 family transposase [Candidatus Limnocylindrales bacterium]
MHRRAKLTVFGRRLLVERIEHEGWPIAHAAAMTGVSRQTATKWVRRYRTQGLAGLEDRSSRPHRSPRTLAPEQVAAILAARHELGVGPHRLAPIVGSPRSTITDVLRRHGLSRLGDRDRPSGVPIRYVRERPGELLHIDVKKLGRIPDGGGHHFRGRGNGTPRARRGYDYIHQAIDDMSRVAYADVFADERGPTCARFLRDAAAWFARQGVRIERVMTDNARNYTLSHDFQAALVDVGARHKRTRFHPPQTNGKSERFNRTLLDEWAYTRPYESNDERLRALPGFIDHYNNHRPHTALKGLTPMAVLVNNVSGNHT